MADPRRHHRTRRTLLNAAARDLTRPHHSEPARTCRLNRARFPSRAPPSASDHYPNIATVQQNPGDARDMARTGKIPPEEETYARA